MNGNIYRLLGQGVYPIVSYCSPQPERTKVGTKWPSRITQDAYDKLAEAGVNVFLSNEEVVGSPTEKYVQIALDCAARASVGYLPRFAIAKEYYSLGKTLKDYRKLSAVEKQELDDRFARELEKYASHPAFYGVSFRDEPGLDMFEGIAAAKKVFDKVCGDKHFYINLYPYYVSAETLQYSDERISSQQMTTYPELSSANAANDVRFRRYIDLYLKMFNPEVIAYDAYPIMTLGEGAEAGIHKVLYEIPAILAEYEKKTGIPFWVFMQEGGKWEGDLKVRIPTAGEHSLQYSVALLSGAKGIQLFPCCYPNAWLGDANARAGLLDIMNNPTDMYGYFVRDARQVRAAGRNLLNATLKAVLSSGKYEGLLAPEKVLRKNQWHDCIYRGEVYGPAAEKYGCLEKIEARTQALVGCFDRNGQDLFYVVNNSSVVSNRVSISFSPDIKMVTVIRDGEQKKIKSAKIDLSIMNAGEGVLLMPEK